MRTVGERQQPASQRVPLRSTAPALANAGLSPGVSSILQLQRTVGNRSVQRLLSPSGLLQRDDDPNPRAGEVKMLLAACPGVDDKVKMWVYPKAQAFILNYYKKLNSSPQIVSTTTWKRPSAWGMLDMDVNFKMIRNFTPEEVQADPGAVLDAVDKAPEQHVKVTVKFRQEKPDEVISVSAELIDWLDGHAVTLQSWQGSMTLQSKSDGQCKIEVTDVAAAEAPKRDKPAKPEKPGAKATA